MRVIDMEYDKNSKPILVTCEDDGETYEFEVVRHGRWIKCKGKTMIWHCSECNRVVKYNPNTRCYQNTKNKLSVEAYNKYCPNCCAKMDLEG